MDISASSPSFTASSSLATQSSAKLHISAKKEEPGESHHHRHQHGEHPGRALGVLRQELQLALKMHSQARFTNAHSGYAKMQQPSSPEEVADEALGAAKQMLAESPAAAASSLISFRTKIQETASFVRESLAPAPEDMEDVDRAMASMDTGMQALEEEAANNRESSATVLAIDTRTRQQSTIRIRTQEGDVIRLSLKNSETTSLVNAGSSDGETTTNATELNLSSRSRIRLRVEGNLNDNEWAAIQNVLTQAESIAEDYFDGDLNSAFKLAQGFEFDSDALARVKLRFRSSERINISYAESISTAAPAGAGTPPAADTAEPVPAIAAPPVDSTTAAVSGANEPEAASPVVAAPPEEAVGETPAPPTAAPPAEQNGLASLFETLRGFLRSVSDGFEAGSANSSLRYHYSESFKLNLLQAVIHSLETPENPGIPEQTAPAE